MIRRRFPNKENDFFHLFLISITVNKISQIKCNVIFANTNELTIFGQGVIPDLLRLNKYTYRVGLVSGRPSKDGEIFFSEFTKDIWVEDEIQSR